MIATRDIAETAAARLTDHAWKGHGVLGLHGPTNLTLDEAVKTLAVIVGRPMKYVQLTPDEFRRVSRGWGMSHDFAETTSRCSRLSTGWAGLPSATLEPRRRPHPRPWAPVQARSSSPWLRLPSVWPGSKACSVSWREPF